MLEIETSSVQIDVIFRSKILIDLFNYFISEYVNLINDSSNQKFFEKMKQDSDLFNLLLTILNKRLIVMDDLEF